MRKQRSRGERRYFRGAKGDHPETQYMTLDEYMADSLSHDEPPPDDVAGELSDWLLVAELAVESGQLWIGDPQFAWAETRGSDGCVVEVPAGKYRVEVRGVDFGGYKLVAQLRVALAIAKDPVAGGEVGECGTDSGQIGVADPLSLASAFEAFGDDDDAALDHLEAGISSPHGVYTPSANDPGKLVFVPSGGSDGGGPVVELLDGGRRVGLLHVFFEDTGPLGEEDEDE